MAAATVEVAVGDKKYTLGPITLKQMAMMERWAREEPFRAMRARLNALGKVDDATRERLLEDALEASRDEGRITAALNTIDAMYKRLELRLRAHHPDISDDEVERVIEAHGIDALTRRLDEVDGEGDGKKAPGGQV